MFHVKEPTKRNFAEQGWLESWKRLQKVEGAWTLPSVRKGLVRFEKLKSLTSDLRIGVPCRYQVLGPDQDRQRKEKLKNPAVRRRVLPRQPTVTVQKGPELSPRVRVSLRHLAPDQPEVRVLLQHLAPVQVSQNHRAWKFPRSPRLLGRGR